MNMVDKYCKEDSNVPFLYPKHTHMRYMPKTSQRNTPRMPVLLFAHDLQANSVTELYSKIYLGTKREA